MSRKSSLAALVLIVVLALQSTPTYPLQSQTDPAKERLWSSLPADTSLLITFKNMKEFRAKYEASPIKKFFEHEGVQDLFADISDEISKEFKNFRKEFGFKPEDLWNQFEGELVLTVGGLSGLKDEVLKMIKDNHPTAPKELAVTLVGVTKGADTKKYVETLFEKSATKKNQKLTKSQAKGAEILTFSEKSNEILHYAQQDTLFVLGTHKKTVESILDRSWAKNPLSQAKGFKQALDKVGDKHDFFFYLDFTQVNRFLQDIVLPAMRDQGGLAEDKAKRLIKAWVDCFGLDEISSFSLGGSMNDSESTGVAYMAIQGKVKGLVRMIMGENKKLEVPASVPKEAVAVNVGQINVAPFWDGFEFAMIETFAVIRSMNPGAPFPDNPMKFIEQFLGINLKTDVVDVLGSEFYHYTVPDEDKLRDVTVIGLKDTGKTKASLEKLTQSLFLQVDKTDHKGTTIYTMNVPGQEEAPSFAVYDNKLVVAPVAWLKDIIDKGGKAANPLRDSEAFKQFGSRIPKEGWGLGYWSPEYLGAFKTVLAEFAKNTPGIDLDVTNFPDGKFFKKLFVGGVSHSVTSSDGFATYYYTKHQKSGQIK